MMYDPGLPVTPVGDSRFRGIVCNSTICARRQVTTEQVPGSDTAGSFTPYGRAARPIGTTGPAGPVQKFRAGIR